MGDTQINHGVAMISELMARAFAARDIAHRAHLFTKSYAEHKALNEFYGVVIEAADAVAENYIGLFGEFDTFEVKTKPVKDISAFLLEEADWLESNAEEIAQGSASIANLVQSLTSVYTKAVYMLRMK